ncbi:MAG: hypothetical protein HYZ53_00475 [Planctomycetes bacterium]|nr:hypothetical protein [Planctomycetota bacterium]
MAPLRRDAAPAHARGPVSVFALALTLTAMAAAAAAADPAPEAGLPAAIVKALKTYYDVEPSLKDFTADAKQTRTEDGQESTLEARVFWKAPDRIKFTSPKTGAELEEDPEVLAEDFLPVRSLATLLGRYKVESWSETKEGDALRVEGKAPSTAGSRATSVTVWLDGAERITRMLAVITDGGKDFLRLETSFQSEERDGKRFLVGMTGKGAPETLLVRMDYTRIGELFVVSRTATEVEQNGVKTRLLIELSNFKLNQGLEDRLFND